MRASGHGVLEIYQFRASQPSGRVGSRRHPTTDPDEDEYGEVETGQQAPPKPASGEPARSNAFVHAKDDD
jgi:hypothetical protein